MIFYLINLFYIPTAVCLPSSPPTTFSLYPHFNKFIYLVHFRCELFSYSSRQKYGKLPCSRLTVFLEKLDKNMLVPCLAVIREASSSSSWKRVWRLTARHYTKRAPKLEVSCGFFPSETRGPQKRGRKDWSSQKGKCDPLNQLNQT